MMQRLRSAIGIFVLGAAVFGLAVRTDAAPLDAEGDLTLGARTYTAARVGTQDTLDSITFGQNEVGTPPQLQQTYRSVTFPVSAAGHLRQSRFFAEVELRHKLDRLIHDGFGPLSLLNDLPFKLHNVGYTLIYRGEYEGVYDYGPGEYSNNDQYHNTNLLVPFQGQGPDIAKARHNLRSVASERQRLFQAYVEADAGPIFFRFGRQILAWGETDVFRLLDNINPVDNSFGGFLIPLDERRVPLDMLRASYKVPDFSFIPFHEMYVEGFAAVDNAVAWDPGIPNGSPWQLPNLQPSATLFSTQNAPPANIPHTRGGFQFKFNAPIPLIEDATFGLAHYYTYLDVPAVQTRVSSNFPATFVPPGLDPNNPQNYYLAEATQTAPTTQITGATTSFLVPSELVRHIGLSGEPIIRSELAYFHNEPRFTQSTLDPFVYGLNGCSGGALDSAGLCTGNIACSQFGTDPQTGKRICLKHSATGPRTGDSWNFVLGMDLNQFIRPLNPNQSFFISTQFFYKHLNGAQKREPIQPLGNYLPGQPHVSNGEVLPVPAYNITSDWRGLSNQQAVDSVFVHNPVDQYLQTLLVATSYYSGQVVPALGVFYDWSGSAVAQPQLTFSRDPFRFTMSYSYLASSSLKGASGISLLHDRDNVLFQFEYVL